jgi:2-oxoglutarate ferredoxin oxidoreductase subunit beta
VAADYFTPHQEITADYAPGSMEDVRMPDGSVLRLRKLENGYDPHDRLAALSHLQEHQAAGEVVTGLLFVDPDASDCHEILDTVSLPLNELGEEDLCPGSEALAGINESFR